LVAWIDFASVALITLLNIAMLHIGIGLIAMPIGAIIVRLLGYIPIFHFARKAYPSLHLSYSYFDWNKAKSILNVSSLWFVGTTSAIIIYSTDNIVIGKFITVEIVTMYYVTYRLSEFLRQRIYSISQTALPGFGQLIGQGDFNRMQYLYLKSQRFILGITVPIVFGVIFFNYDFVRLWVGQELFAGQQITLFFAVLLFIMVFYHSSSVVLSSGMQLRPIAWSRGIEAILNLILSILGAKKFGIMGVAGATIVSNLLTSFWYIPYQTIKFLKLKPIMLYREVYVFTLLLLLMNMTLYAFYLHYDFLQEVFIYKALIFSIVNMIGFWFLSADTDLRARLINKSKLILIRVLK
jgi:O-antigen/teichoic acid export membrane protein